MKKNSIRAVACIRFVQRLWRRAFPPKPSGPCVFCGMPTTQTNLFDSTLFRHEKCRDMARAKKERKQKEREQIELIKQALREVESEKMND